MKENSIDLVSFAQESKNPTLKDLTKKANNALKAKENTVNELNQNENDLKNCENDLNILQNGSDYIDKVKELSNDKYDAFLKLLNVKSFDPANLTVVVSTEYEKTTEMYEKNIKDLKEKISDNNLKIDNYTKEYSELSDEISDYKMKLKPLVDLLILASDDSATNRQRAEEIIDNFDELKEEKRDLCAKIIFPDTKFRNSIKRVFAKEQDIIEEKNSDFEKGNQFNENSVQIDEDIVIPIIDNEINEQDDNIENNDMSQEILKIFDKNDIDYQDCIEEYSQIDETKAMNVMKVFDILSQKNISISNLKYSAKNLLNVDPDKFNSLLSDLLSVKPKRDVSLCISGLLDPTINLDNVRDKILNDSTLPIVDLLEKKNMGYEDIFKGDF